MLDWLLDWLVSLAAAVVAVGFVGWVVYQCAPILIFVLRS